MVNYPVFFLDREAHWWILLRRLKAVELDTWLLMPLTTHIASQTYFIIPKKRMTPSEMLPGLFTDHFLYIKLSTKLIEFNFFLKNYRASCDRFSEEEFQTSFLRACTLLFEDWTLSPELINKSIHKWSFVLSSPSRII